MSTSGYHSSSPSSAVFQRPDTGLREFAPPTRTDETELAGSSAAMERLRLQVRRIGPHFRTVLVSGEAGCGKERVARALHSLSQGADRPFVVCHAATLETALADASSGIGRNGRANADGGDRITALMSMASRGTLFLDDAEEMPLEAQGQLLRVLRRQEWSQDGTSGARKLSVRLIASSSQDLRGLVAAGHFRQELYRRIATLEIALPALRERIEDLPELANGFLRRCAAMYGKSVERIAEEAMQRLMEYRWPGNVGELERVVCNAVLMSEGTELRAQELPELAASEIAASRAGVGGMAPLQDVVEQHVLHVLKSCAGNKLRAAEVLGISRSTLYRMLESCSQGDRLP